MVWVGSKCGICLSLIYIVSCHVDISFQNRHTFAFDHKEEDARIVSNRFMVCFVLHFKTFSIWYVPFHFSSLFYLKQSMTSCALWSLLQKLCQGLLTVLRRSDHPLCQSTCLETLRILSRDKRVLGPVATKEGILTLAGLARIHVAGHDGEPLEEAQSSEEERVVVEALKCLCNVVFNSVPAQQVGADMKLAEGLCARLHSVSSSHHEVGLFSLRLLFLLSALRTDVRGMLQKEAGAVRLLTDILERTLDVCWVGPYEAAPP